MKPQTGETKPKYGLPAYNSDDSHKVAKAKKAQTDAIKQEIFSNITNSQGADYFDNNIKKEVALVSAEKIYDGMRTSANALDPIGFQADIIVGFLPKIAKKAQEQLNEGTTTAPQTAVQIYSKQRKLKKSNTGAARLDFLKDNKVYQEANEKPTHYVKVKENLDAILAMEKDFRETRPAKSVPKVMQHRLAVVFYKGMEENPEKRSEFAANQLDEYCRNDNLLMNNKGKALDSDTKDRIKNAIVEIFEPLCTSEKAKQELKDNAGKLVREFATSDKKEMSFGQEWKKFIDKVGKVFNELLGREDKLQKVMKDNPAIMDTLKQSLGRYKPVAQSLSLPSVEEPTTAPISITTTSLLLSDGRTTPPPGEELIPPPPTRIPAPPPARTSKLPQNRER